MKAQKGVEVSTLRLLWAALKNRQFELRKTAGLTDEETAAVTQREIKQRRDSVAAYQQGGRPELAEKENAELKLLGKYLPQQMSSSEIEKIVAQVVAATKPSGPGDFGKVMGAVMGRIKGQADGNEVANLVKQKLAKEK